MLQKWSNNFHKNCWNTFWTLINFPLRFVTLDYTRKRPKSFLHWKDCLFFSKLYVFQQLLRCYRSDLITSTKIVGIPFWTLTKCPLRFVTLDYTRKNAKIFFSLESLPFFSKICFQQPLRFFKIWSYYFRSETQITSWTLTKCSLRFVILDNSIIGEKKGQNLFFTGKIAFFFKTLCFPTTS